MRPLIILSLLASIAAPAASGPSAKGTASAARHFADDTRAWATDVADHRSCIKAGHAQQSPEPDALQDKVMLLAAKLGFDTVSAAEIWEEQLQFIARMSSTAPDPSLCDSTSAQLRRTEERIDKRLEAAYKGRVPPLSSCPLPADLYKARYEKSGSISTLTCFQRAVRREVDAAQR